MMQSLSKWPGVERILAQVYLLQVHFFFIDCPRTNVRVSSVIDAFRNGAGGMEALRQAGQVLPNALTVGVGVGSVCVSQLYGVHVLRVPRTYTRNSIPEKKIRTKQK